MQAKSEPKVVDLKETKRKLKQMFHEEEEEKLPKATNSPYVYPINSQYLQQSRSHNSRPRRTRKKKESSYIIDTEKIGVSSLVNSQVVKH